MASFKGYAISTVGEIADHTYVQVDDKYYGCWGRKKGGDVVCHGSGNAKHAHCMANWECIDGTAGIIYGETGVCHQTANRILRPARIAVYKAKGYMASHLLYGTYGSSYFLWKIKKHHCLHEHLYGIDELQENQDKRTLVEQLAQNELSLKEAINQNALIEFRDVVAALSDKKLTLPHDKLAQIIHLQNDLRAESHLHIEGISLMSDGKEFANRQNALINAALKTLSTLLSPEEYKTLFNVDVGQKITVVDPQIMTYFFDMFVKK